MQKYPTIKYLLIKEKGHNKSDSFELLVEFKQVLSKITINKIVIFFDRNDK